MTQPTYKANCLGWNAQFYQGQFEIDEVIIEDNLKDPRSGITDPHPFPTKVYNILACVPGANVVFGVFRIFTAVLGNREGYFVREEDAAKWRWLMFVVGVAEITWIGGLLVHSVASIYFSNTRNPTVSYV